MSGSFPQPGDRFADRYDIAALVAMGGFSRVYRAHEPEHERDVALKVMSPARLESSGLASVEKRFYREARVISRLESPHTVRLLDYGRTNTGLLFLAMEFVEGRDLESALKQDGPMGEDRVRRILVQVLESLHEAHGLQIVHRDIKPANIMLAQKPGAEEHVKLIDFGVAKSVAKNTVDQSLLTVAGFILGTPKYMSPEQAIGSEVLRPTSDIFSTGLVAYEMLVGRSPYPDGAGALSDVIRAEVTVPKLLGISDELRDVVNRMLKLNPTARFPSAEAVLRALNIDIGGLTKVAAVSGPLRVASAGPVVAFPLLDSSLGAEAPATVIWSGEPISADTRLEPTGAARRSPPPIPRDAQPPPTTRFERSSRPNPVIEDRTTRFASSSRDSIPYPAVDTGTRTVPRERSERPTNPPVPRAALVVAVVLVAIVAMLFLALIMT